MGTKFTLRKYNGTNWNDEYYPVTDWANIKNKPSNYTPSSHNHSYNDLNDTPTIPSVSNATITIKQTGLSDQTFTLNGSATTITLADSNTTYSEATTSAAGLMSAADKTKLDSLSSALRYKGDCSTSAPSAGNYLKVSVGGSTLYVSLSNSGTATEVAASVGDVVAMSNNEYVCTTAGKFGTSVFRELGSESSYALVGHTHSYAGSSSVGGAATSANKLNTNAGSATQPVYFSNGVPVATTYSLSKSVPSDADFTNTWRPLGTTADTACAGNDSRLSDSRPASDVYSWAKASSKPSYTHNEIGAGDLTIGDGANELYFRTNASWTSGVYYHTTGQEALVFANKNASTSWIFSSGNDVSSRTDWSTLDGASGHLSKPSMQIKNGTVAINKLIANNGSLSYNLDVNGTANATTLYENGTALSSKYQAAGSYAAASHTHSQYLTSHQDISGKADKVSMTAGTYKRVTVNSQGIVTGGDNVDANDNTWRPIAVGGTNKLTDSSTTLNFAGSGATSVSYSNGTITISSTDTNTNTWRPVSGTGSSDNAARADHYHTSLKSNTDNRSTNTTPNDYNSVFNIVGLKSNSTIGLNATTYGTYSGVFGMRGWSDSSGGNSHEFALCGNGQIAHRQGATTSWGSWRILAHTDDIPSIYDWAKASTKPSYSFSGSAVTSGANSGTAISCIGGGSVSLADTASSGGIVFLTGEVSGSTLTITTKRLTASFTGSGGGSCAPSGHTHSVTAAGSVS